jgi:hypothetical protein
VDAVKADKPGGTMRLKAKAGIVTAIGALAITGPAVAEACTQGQGQGQVKDQHVFRDRGDHGQFSGIKRHGRRFGHSAFGTLVSWNATQTGTNTYSGTITISKGVRATPGFTAHHSGTGTTTQPTQVTYTFTNAKVLFGQGANPPAAGDLVKVLGARLNHCNSTSSGTDSPSTSSSTGNVRAILIAAPPSSSSNS